MPYDAMKGLAEALKDREERHSRVQKHGISEEDMERISSVLLHVEKGSKAFVSYYANFHDRETEGIVTEINRAYRFLRVGEEKIPFEDLYDIRVTG
jgi:YolD-like protein.